MFLLTFRTSLIALLFATSGTAVAECLPPPAAPNAETLQQLKQQAKDRGFLWKISKDGRQSWLYGTIHINHLSSFFPGPNVTRALHESKIIALELNPNDAATQSQMAKLAAQGAGQVPPALKPRLKTQLDKVCLPESFVQALHPAFLFASLGLLNSRADGLEAAYGVENSLVKVAQADGHPIVALETVESQMHALLGDDTRVTAAEYAEALTILESGTERAMAKNMVKAWEDSDLAYLASFEQWCECVNTPKQRADLKRLLDDRNPALADGIAKLHQSGAPIFAAVGSLHMVGKLGLPNLLKQRGFKVERVVFN